MKISATLRDIFAVLLIIFVPIIVLATPVGILYVMLLTRACYHGVTVNTVSDLSGLDFETVIVECDSPVRNSYADILVSKTGSSNRLPIFEYGPIFDEVSKEYFPPSIKVNDKSISILVERSVKSIY